MKDIIKLNNNMRVVIEVLDNGSVVVTLEQSVSRTSLSDKTWQPVNFKSFGGRNGYKVNPPSLIGKLFGDSLERRVSKAVSKCRAAATELNNVQATISKLIPKDSDQEARSLKGLVRTTTREIYQRLKRNYPDERNLTDMQLSDVSLVLASVVDYVNNLSGDFNIAENMRTSRGLRTPISGGGYLGRISIGEAPLGVRAALDHTLQDLLELDSLPTLELDSLPTIEEIPNTEAPIEETRRERIDDLIVHNDDHDLPVPSEETENETIPTLEENSKK